MKNAYYLSICVLLLLTHVSISQKMTVEEYQMVKDFRINDLDNDTYIKLDNNHVLDRYQMKPPYYIASSTDAKNRVDLYTYIRRDDLSELGLLAVFTDVEEGKVMHLCLPFQAEKDVWTQYYDDLKYGGRDNPDMIFAITSVFSKELSNVFVQGKTGDNYEVESSDYDICFSGDQLVLLDDGAYQPIADIRAGDLVMSINAEGQLEAGKAVRVEVHRKKSRLVKLIALPVEISTASNSDFYLKPTSLSATPNHPMMTENGLKELQNVEPGDLIVGTYNGRVVMYRVIYWSISDEAESLYNLITPAGNYIVNELVVSDKR